MVSASGLAVVSSSVASADQQAARAAVAAKVNNPHRIKAGFFFISRSPLFHF